ncbi:MAG: hypothetical protein HKN93_06645 [Acidimicrobiia bacterium]|nr:hypothetical protein [Acidimicrobiia bacterium]
MITNTDLARVINMERYDVRPTHTVASTEAGQLRHALGRRLEALGKRLQGAPQPRQTRA